MLSHHIVHFLESRMSHILRYRHSLDYLRSFIDIVNVFFIIRQFDSRKYESTSNRRIREHDVASINVLRNFKRSRPPHLHRSKKSFNAFVI